MKLWIYRSLRWAYLKYRWVKQSWTALGLGVFVILLVSGFVGIWSAQSMSHMVFFLALFMLAIAWISSRWIQYDYKATRSLPRFGTVGEPLEYLVKFRNLTSSVQRGLLWKDAVPEDFPRYREFLAFRDRCLDWRDLFLQWPTFVAQRRWAIAPMQSVPPLAPQGKTELKGAITPLRRGALNLRGITVLCTDPLGLSYQQRTFEMEQSICILPRRYQLPDLSLLVSRKNQMGDQVLTDAVGEALEFRSLRDYRPGDPTNKIHWKSWAKVGRPIVKEQQDESTVRHGLIVDSCPTPDGHALFEEVLAIATSILIQDPSQAALLDVMFMAETVRRVTVGQGLRQRAQILETLATLEPSPAHKFEAMLPMVQSRLTRLSGCICVFNQWDSTREDVLKKLAQYQIPTQVYVLMPVCPLITPDPAWSFYCRIQWLVLGQVQEDLQRI